MPTKTSQLQIRVSPAQKAALRRLADARGLSISAFVLERALPTGSGELEGHIRSLSRGGELRNSLSDLQIHLHELDDAALADALASVDPAGLSPLVANCLAAAAERECWRRGLAAPQWASSVRPLSRPVFTTGLSALKPHLMHIAPPAFKRRGVYAAAPGDPRF